MDETLRTAEILASRPDRQLFRDGCPGGESPSEIGAPIASSGARAANGGVLIFSSGHFLRVMTARWLGLEAQAGRYLVLGTLSLSALSYEHDRSQPVIQFWNDTHHPMLH